MTLRGGVGPGNYSGQSNSWIIGFIYSNSKDLVDLKTQFLWMLIYLKCYCCLIFTITLPPLNADSQYESKTLLLHHTPPQHLSINWWLQECPHRLPSHTHTPCCFQNVRSAWAVLIVLIVMIFLYIQQQNTICDSLLPCTHRERESTDCLVSHQILVVAIKITARRVSCVIPL